MPYSALEISFITTAKANALGEGWHLHSNLLTQPPERDVISFKGDIQFVFCHFMNPLDMRFSIFVRDALFSFAPCSRVQQELMFQLRGILQEQKKNATAQNRRCINLRRHTNAIKSKYSVFANCTLINHAA